jgi:phosphocarrier protein HPr
MIEKNITLLIPNGLHARPSSYLSHKLCEMDLDSIILIYDEEEADMKSVISLMALGIVTDSIVKIRANGKDEDKAIVLIEEVFSKKE